MAVIQYIATYKRRITKPVMLGFLMLGLLGLGPLHKNMLASLDVDAAALSDIETAAGGDLAVRVHADGRAHMLQLSNATNRLEDLFASLDYDLRAIAAGHNAVPPVYVSALPVDLPGLRVVERRKDVFIRTMLPLVLAENANIREDRRRIIAIRTDLEGGRAVTAAAQSWLSSMMTRYKVKDAVITPEAVEKLLVKVDVIPPSLAVAQAIVESGWGTSRFAREGNAIFGQWTWSSAHDGMVPGSRDTGKKHRIRSFDTLGESVASYMLNLNRHYAYAGLRKRRVAMRETGMRPTGPELAGQLSRYSTKREGYVRLLRSLIRTNDLAGLDTAALADSVIISRIDVADSGL